MLASRMSGRAQDQSKGHARRERRGRPAVGIARPTGLPAGWLAPDAASRSPGALNKPAEREEVRPAATMVAAGYFIASSKSPGHERRMHVANF